jgi:multimeric flavodoxin WrbA
MKDKVFIVGINGSPHKKGTTAKLLKKALDSAKKYGAKTFLIDIVDKNIKQCLGCYSVKHDSCEYPCKQKDDMQEIYKILLKSDAIIFASPIYWFNVTGLMKNFIDRLTCLECSGFMLEGKIAGFISVSKEDEGGNIVPSMLMASILNHMGLIIPPYAMMYYPAFEGDWNWSVKDLDLLAKSIIKLSKSIKKSKIKSWDYKDKLPV